jgi:membrane protein required for colicin V production
MPSYLDIGLIVVVLISALLSMLRGFTREVLAIASWGAAAAAAFYFYPLLLPTMKSYIAKDQLALAAAVGAIFFASLIVVSVITVRLSDVILDSRIGALDRSLGFIFGAGRGALLCVVAFVFYSWLVPHKAQPDWVKNSRTAPLLAATGDHLMAMLPDDPESAILSKFKKPKGDEPMPEVTVPPTTAPGGGRRS